MNFDHPSFFFPHAKRFVPCFSVFVRRTKGGRRKQRINEKRSIEVEEHRDESSPKKNEWVGNFINCPFRFFFLTRECVFSLGCDPRKKKCNAINQSCYLWSPNGKK